MIYIPKRVLKAAAIVVAAFVWYHVITYTFHQGFTLMPVLGAANRIWSFICAMVFAAMAITTIIVSVAWLWNTVENLATYLDKAYKAKIRDNPNFSLWNLIGIMPYDPAEEKRRLAEKEKYQFKKVDPRTGLNPDASNTIDQDEIK